jgi:hypothetical protein
MLPLWLHILHPMPWPSPITVAVPARMFLYKSAIVLGIERGAFSEKKEIAQKTISAFVTIELDQHWWVRAL